MEEWNLWYYVRSLDDRVNLRGDVAQLRADPHVQDVVVPTLNPDEPEVRVTVIFREGTSTTQDPRLRTFRERREPSDSAHALSRDFTSPLNALSRFARLLEAIQNGDQFPERVNLERREDEPDSVLRQRIAQQYINSGSGRQRLFGSATMPSLRSLDYTSVARRVFMVDELPAGALPIYTEDPDVISAIEESTLPDVSMGAQVPFRREPTERNLGDYVMGVDPGGPDFSHFSVSWVANPTDPHARIQGLIQDPGSIPNTARYPVSDSMVKGRPLPAWCISGAWVAKLDSGLVHQVQLVEATVVGLTRFDTGEIVYWSRFEKPFLAVWRSVPDPRRTWFDRLLEAQ